jgi:hypothetical protein
LAMNQATSFNAMNHILQMCRFKHVNIEQFYFDE